MLAAAFTTHKSQSMQFDNTVIEVGNLFAANLLYVAITRNKTLAGMVLVGRRLKKDDFRLHAGKLMNASALKPFSNQRWMQFFKLFAYFIQS